MSSFLENQPISSPAYKVVYKKDIPSRIYPDDSIKEILIK